MPLAVYRSSSLQAAKVAKALQDAVGWSTRLSAIYGKLQLVRLCIPLATITCCCQGLTQFCPIWQAAEAAAAALDAGPEALERQARGVAAALGAELATGSACFATS